MKKIYLLAGLAAMMIASCSTEEQSSGGSGYVAGSTVTLNASLPNSGTRVNEAPSDTYGLITNWSDDDSLDVLVNTNTIVSMTKSTGNTFTATPATPTIAAGFNPGQTIYGVNNKFNDKITTALYSSRLRATLDFTGQNGTVDNLKKYDLMYGNGDPTGNITFNHKICVMRLDINSDALKADGITSITGLKLKYVVSSGTKLFGSKEVYNFGTTCDSTITDVDSIYLQNTSISVADGKAVVYIAVPHRQNLYGTLYIGMKGTNGTDVPKIYNLTNALSLTNGRMLMSTVHPLAITALNKTLVTPGYYLYSDGSCGSGPKDYYDSATPVALIFSKTTSTADQAKGWTHGYAMALKNASTGCIWGPTTTNPTGTNITTTATMIADKDGLTHTPYINSSTYPAGYAAATTYKSSVPAPASSSGWYLPSIGQWYDIFVNLGKINATGYTPVTGYLYWSGQASTCVANLNAYLTPLTSGTYDTFTWSSSAFCLYWSSSEYSSSRAYLAGFITNGNLYLGSENDKSYTNIVRGVVAF